MAVQPILSTDTLESGFRAKANANFNEIIQSITPVLVSGISNGQYKFNLFGGGFFILDLSANYYTKSDIAQLISNIGSGPYKGAWDLTKSPYASQDVVDHEGTFWRSAAGGNTDEPGTSGTWTNIIDTGASAAYLEVPFSTASGITINWQTDIPPGKSNTYATILGNNIPKPFVEIPTGVTDQSQNIPFDYKYTRSGGLIQTVVLDWSVSYDAGLIVF